MLFFWEGDQDTSGVGRGMCNNSLERKQLNSLRAPINSGSGQGRKASQDSQLPTPYPTPPTPVMTRLIKNPHLPRSFSSLFFLMGKKERSGRKTTECGSAIVREWEESARWRGEVRLIDSGQTFHCNHVDTIKAHCCLKHLYGFTLGKIKKTLNTRNKWHSYS